MNDQHEQIQRMIKEAVSSAFKVSTPPMSPELIEGFQASGQLERVIAEMITATRSALEWGTQTLAGAYGLPHYLPRPSDVELDAIAFTAILEAIAEVVPPEGAIAVAQATIARWFDLSTFESESIPAAVYLTAREMGLSMQNAKSVEILDEAEGLLGHFLRL